MALKGPVHQWDTFVADLDYPGGSGHGVARRSVIVVSNDGFNANFPVVTVVPLTKREGKKRRVYPFEVVIPARLAGNRVESIVMPYQIRTIDKARLLEPLGRVADPAVRSEIEDRIIEHLGVSLRDGAEGATEHLYGPKVRSLLGALRTQRLHKADYRRHLDRTHR